MIYTSPTTSAVNGTHEFPRYQSITTNGFYWDVEAATCRIHLWDDDPYEELLHNIDEVATLLQDPVVLAAMNRLLDPDADLDKL